MLMPPDRSPPPLDQVDVHNDPPYSPDCSPLPLDQADMHNNPPYSPDRSPPPLNQVDVHDNPPYSPDRSPLPLDQADMHDKQPDPPLHPLIDLDLDELTHWLAHMPKHARSMSFIQHIRNASLDDQTGLIGDALNRLRNPPMEVLELNGPCDKLAIENFMALEHFSEASCHDRDTRSTLYHSVRLRPRVYRLFHCMYLRFPIVSIFLVSLPIGERFVRSIFPYDYLICFHLWSRLLSVPVPLYLLI